MSIQETIKNSQKGRTTFLRANNRIFLLWQRITRSALPSRLKIFYPYRNLLNTHPFFLRYYKYPPLRYCNRLNANLFHWVSCMPYGSSVDKPYIIEPQDHPLSPTRKTEPREVLANVQHAIDIYMDPLCKNILVIAVD